MERSIVRDFIVGLFVLAGIGTLAYLSISIGGFTWHGHGGLKLYAKFSESGLLTVRSPVVIAGVQVGEVKAITLDKRFDAVVEMDVDKSLQLPTDTSASILTAGMLGDRYIALQPGAEDQMLKNGDEIGFTEPAMILERVMGQVVYGLTKGDSKTNATEPAATQSRPAKKP